MRSFRIYNGKIKLDVMSAPVTGSRPANTLTAIDADSASTLAGIFSETGTLGVRMRMVEADEFQIGSKQTNRKADI